MSNFISSEQQLLKGLKDVLDNTDLKTYEKMIMIVIKVYQAEHEQVFPDYDTIAAAGGMSKRKAQYVVKDLVNRNLIEKRLVSKRPQAVLLNKHLINIQRSNHLQQRMNPT